MGKLAAAALVLLAIAAAAILSDRPLPPADFTFVNVGDVGTLDPQRMSWRPDLRVGRLVYEGLLQTDVRDPDLAIVPAAAESWTVSADRLTYTFTIRDDARWSNGDRVTAHDFVYSWRRGMLPDLAADYAQMFHLIRGAREFYEWRAHALAELAAGRGEHADGAALWEATLDRFAETVGLRAIDDVTLVVELDDPVPYFLDLCAFGVFSPVYPPLVAPYERPDPETGRLRRRTGWTRPEHHVGNGPYALEVWRFQRDMRFGVNPHHRQSDSLRLRSIHIPSIEDPNVAVLAFRTSAVDWVSDVATQYRGDMLAEKRAFYEEHADTVARLRDQGVGPFEIDRRLPPDPRAHVHAVPAFGTYFWNFNCSPSLPGGRANPFHDPRVRRAFALVTDKRAVVEGVRRLGERTAGALTPPGSLAGYRPPPGLPNIGDAPTPEHAAAIRARAMLLLAEAGYPDPASDFPVTVELLFNKDAGHDLIAQVIAKGWREHLGVGVRLVQKEVKVFREDLRGGDYLTSKANWFGDYADPTTFLGINRSSDGNNDRGFADAAYDAMLDDAAREPDPAARLALLAEAERYLVEEAVPLVPIFHYNDVVLFDPRRVTGLSSHPRGEQDFSVVDVRDAARDGPPAGALP